MTRPEPVAEPHKIKTVRLLSFPTIEERKRHLAGAHFNVFNLTPSQITFDMTSTGTSAMSQEQLAGQLLGDEAYAGSRNFERLQVAVRDVLGHGYVCPTHNILGSVKLLVATLVPSGSVVPSNGRDRMDVLTPREVEVVDVRDRTRARLHRQPRSPSPGGGPEGRLAFRWSTSRPSRTGSTRSAWRTCAPSVSWRTVTAPAWCSTGPG